MSLLKGLKSLVSQDRIRYQQDGFDLDLSYITDNILAMSIPSSGVAAMWRNKIKDVHRLLYTRHGDCFMIWNLSETKYNYDLFDNQILDFPFPDHHAPPIILLATIVKSIDGWIQASSNNVAVVHCKGGKGRTGIVIICWLMYSGVRPFMKDAMRLFAEKRSTTKKGVTQPSQLRYVNYFNMIISRKVKLTVRELKITEIVIGPLPADVKVTLSISTYSDSYDSKCAFSSTPEGARVEAVGNNEVRLVVPVGIVVSRDFLIVARQKGGKELFHMSLNTSFIENTDHTENFCRKELDCFDKSVLLDTLVAIKFNKTSDHEEVDERFMSRVAEMQKIYSERVTRKLMEQNKTAFGSNRLKSTVFLEASSTAKPQDQQDSAPRTQPQVASEGSSIVIGKEKLIIKEEEEANIAKKAAEAEAAAAAAEAKAAEEEARAKEREKKQMESQQKGGKNGAAQTVGDGDGDGGDSPGRVRLMIKQIEGNDGRGNGGGKRGSVHNGGKVKRLIEELEKPKDWTGQKVEIVSDVSVKQMVQKFESENDKKIEMQIRKVKIRDSMMITPGTQVASTGKDGGKQEFPWLRNVRISGVYDDSLAKGHYSFNLHVDDKNEFILPFDEDGEEEDDDDDDDENDNGDNSERFYSDVDNDNNTVEYILPDKSQKKSLATATTATATTSAAKPQTVIAQDRKDDDDIQKQHQQKTAAAVTVAVAAHQEAEEDKEPEPQKVKQEQRAHKLEQERQAKVPQEQKQEQEQQKEEQQEQQPYEEEQPIEQPQVNEEKGSENNEVHQTECPLQDINDACKEETLLEASPVQEHQELPLLQEPLLPLQPQPQPPSSFQEQPPPQAQQYHQQPELFKPEEENDDDSGENIVEISEPQQPEQPPEQPRNEQTPAVVDEEKGEVKRDEEVPMSTTVPGGLQHEVHEAENVSKAEEPLEPEQHQPCEQYEYVMSQKMPTEMLVQTPVIQQHEEQQQQEQPISQQEEKPMLQQKELGEPVNVDVNAQSTVSGPAKAEPSNAQEASRATTAKAKEERPAIIIGVNKVLYRKATAAQLLGKESSAHQPPVQPQQSPSPSIGSWKQGTRSQQRAKNAYTFFRKK